MPLLRFDVHYRLYHTSCDIQLRNRELSLNIITPCQSYMLLFCLTFIISFPISFFT